MSGSYFTRYMNGSVDAVWTELVSLGSDIRQEPLYSDAVAVARETMRRVRHNLELIVDRLHQLDYRFTYPDSVLDPPDAERIAELNRIEQEYGPLPLALRLWYEEVGAVSLLGNHPLLCQNLRDEAFVADAPVSDPLYITHIDQWCDPMDYTIEPAYAALIGPRYEVDLAPDLCMKAGMSGGAGTRIVLPCAAIDAPLLSSDWPGLSFMTYIRISLQWGGFARFLLLPEAAIAARKELEFLTRDLLEF